MKKILLLIFLSGLSVNAFAAPSGEDLLTACEDSLANGFSSTRGMMCIWYVTPCDCNHGDKKKVPRVCLPDDASHVKLAKEVISGLKENPEFQAETAEMAAGLILAPKYPCD